MLLRALCVSVVNSSDYEAHPVSLVSELAGAAAAVSPLTPIPSPPETGGEGADRPGWATTRNNYRTPPRRPRGSLNPESAESAAVRCAASSGATGFRHRLPLPSTEPRLHARPSRLTELGTVPPPRVPTSTSRFWGCTQRSAIGDQAFARTFDLPLAVSTPIRLPPGLLITTA